MLGPFVAAAAAAIIDTRHGRSKNGVSSSRRRRGRRRRLSMRSDDDRLAPLPPVCLDFFSLMYGQFHHAHRSRTGTTGREGDGSPFANTAFTDLRRLLAGRASLKSIQAWVPSCCISTWALHVVSCHGMPPRPTPSNAPLTQTNPLTPKRATDRSTRSSSQGRAGDGSGGASGAHHGGQRYVCSCFIWTRRVSCMHACIVSCMHACMLACGSDQYTC